MKGFLFTLFFICSFCAQAQEESITIYTDRPGFSDYPKTIPKGYIQFEAGFSFETETTNPNDRIQLVNWNNTLVKYGLFSGLELRLGQTYQSERLLKGGTSPEFVWQSFSGPLVVGTKINLLKEAGVVPLTAILVEYGINTFGADQFVNNSFLRAQISSKYQLNPEWYLMANLGYDERTSNVGRLRYTLNTGYSVNEKLALYAEIYGFRSEFLTPLNYFDAGITYLLNPKFQLDIHAGFDLAKQANNIENYQQSFVSIGLGYLLKLQK